MIKIGDKVRLLKRGSEETTFREIGKGTVDNIMTNKIGEIKFIRYMDKEWPENVSEIVSVDSLFFKVVSN